eukprot:1898929-Heterocapsa_arctica.AAC.1
MLVPKRLHPVWISCLRDFRVPSCFPGPSRILGDLDLVLAPNSLGRFAPPSPSGFTWPPFAWGSLGRSSCVSSGKTCAEAAKSLRSSWPPVSRGPSYA